ncbi:MAG: hypothetical protein FRX49_05945 [Trebouxia sp. A1-2]|nr:MAG: hypothetical protein FRX49_05945 [Trebouxia sp. A1-2]
MASQNLKSFLSSVNSGYLHYADAIYDSEFTSQAELGAADRADLQALGIPKGAAGLIIAAARGAGSALILKDGCLVAIHPEAINALRERLQHAKLVKDGLTEAEKSIDAIVNGGVA